MPSSLATRPPPEVGLEPPASPFAVAFPFQTVAAVQAPVGQPAGRLWVEPPPLSPPAVAPFFEGPISLPPPTTSPLPPIPFGARGKAWHAAAPVAASRLSLATARLAVCEVIMA